jgi:hypothetical protein
VGKSHYTRSSAVKESFDLVATTTNKYKCSRSEKPISKDIDNPEMMDFGELEMGLFTIIIVSNSFSTKGTKIKVKLPRQSDIIDECRLCRTKMYVYMEFLFIINKKVNCPTMGR